jgi:hypothetical protein
MVNTGGRLNPNYKELSGRGFFEDLAQGLSSLTTQQPIEFAKSMDVAAPVEVSKAMVMGRGKPGVSSSQLKAVKDAIKNVYNKIQDAKPMSSPTSAPASMTGSGKRKNPRAEIVKKVMREKSLSLAAASKYVKDNGLY